MSDEESWVFKTRAPLAKEVVDQAVAITSEVSVVACPFMSPPFPMNRCKTHYCGVIFPELLSKDKLYKNGTMQCPCHAYDKPYVADAFWHAMSLGWGIA